MKKINEFIAGIVLIGVIALMCLSLSELQRMAKQMDRIQETQSDTLSTVKAWVDLTVRMEKEVKK